jgi:prepilin-type N-terminal cleavage/methylation domain-containing protein
VAVERWRLGVRKERSDRGFTMIEVLIALIVLTIGVAGVLSGLTTITLSSVHTNEQARATALAVQKMEELKALPVADIEPQAAVAVDENGVEGSGPYRRKVDVVHSTVGLKTAEITVDVEYAAGRMGKRHVQLVTLVYSGS